MVRYFNSLDTFTRNIILVFAGTSLVNFLNLLYQLLIAHKLAPSEFAAFNTLLSIYMLIASPLGTLQVAVAKYTAEYNVRNQLAKVRRLLSELIRNTLFLSLVIFFASLFILNYAVASLKIQSSFSGMILALLISLACLNPIITGGVQGLELFGFFTGGSLISGLLKLGLAFLLIKSGYGIAGALGALLAATVVNLIIYYAPLKKYISLKYPKEEGINLKEMFGYLIPVAISTFSFTALVSFDMVLVKYFFPAADSGLYSLAQMLGKIFLFLPGAIALVILPRASGLNAVNKDTFATLKKSLFFVVILCAAAFIIYNLFPEYCLTLLTGKAYKESILLGRLFSISMSLFALVYVLIYYFLSLKKMFFIRILVFSTFLQNLAIILFHRSLLQVQLILCINSALLALALFILANSRRR